MLKLWAFTPQKANCKTFFSTLLIKGVDKYSNGEVESLERQKQLQDQNEGKSSKLMHEIPGNKCPRRLVFKRNDVPFFPSIEVVVMTFEPGPFLFNFISCGKNT